MKTSFLTALILLVSIISFAQNQKTEHLTFKGIAIDGTLTDYVSKMKQNGFIHQSTNDGIAVLSGDFAGYKDCLISVSTIKQKDFVNKIVVAFPDKKTWVTLLGNYNALKEMLTEKYGKPSEVIEEFDERTYSEPTDDRSKMLSVGLDKCKYSSTWKTAEGDIQLKISHKGVMSTFVTLDYTDKINSEVKRDHAKDDLR